MMFAKKSIHMCHEFGASRSLALPAAWFALGLTGCIMGSSVGFANPERDQLTGRDMSSDYVFSSANSLNSTTTQSYAAGVISADVLQKQLQLDSAKMGDTSKDEDRR
jgi:hypothetical protein